MFVLLDFSFSGLPFRKMKKSEAHARSTQSSSLSMLSIQDNQSYLVTTTTHHIMCMCFSPAPPSAEEIENGAAGRYGEPYRVTGSPMQTGTYSIHMCVVYLTHSLFSP